MTQICKIPNKFADSVYSLLIDNPVWNYRQIPIQIATVLHRILNNVNIPNENVTKCEVRFNKRTSKEYTLLKAIMQIKASEIGDIMALHNAWYGGKGVTNGRIN